MDNVFACNSDISQKIGLVNYCRLIFQVLTTLQQRILIPKLNLARGCPSYLFTPLLHDRSGKTKVFNKNRKCGEKMLASPSADPVLLIVTLLLLKCYR
jgi:hypothetical protein